MGYLLRLKRALTFATALLQFLGGKILAGPMPSTHTLSSVAFPPTLVLGASGRLGRMLGSLWSDLPVTWATRAGHEDSLKLDPLTDTDLLTDTVAAHKTALCLSGVTPGQGNLDLNSRIACAVVRAAAETGATVFLFSTAAVYGSGDEVWAEDAMLSPISAYGRAKQRMEADASNLAHALGVRTCVLRIANVAGADAILAGWAPGFALDVLPDGTTPLRSYIGPHGLANVLAQLVRRHGDIPPLLNVATPMPVRMGDLLEAAGLPWTTRQANETTTPKAVFDVSKLASIITFDSNTNAVAAIVNDWQTWQKRVISN